MQDIFDKVNPESFAPPEPLWVKVFDFLREAIVRGHIKPGEKINEALIASKLGISRSPVREAIRVLESQDFVETVAQRGPFVKRLTIKEAEDLFFVLRFFQSAGIQRAVDHMGEERLEELRTIVKDMEASRGTRDIEKIRAISKRFHDFIFQASGNHLLIKLNESLRFQQERLRLWGASRESEDFDAIMDEHLAISKAMMNQNAQEADRLMKDHVDKARLRGLKALSRLEQDEVSRPGSDK